MISLIIPLYNEEKLVEDLYRETSEALNKITQDYEIICVNDGSSDNTLKFLLTIHNKDKRLKILNLSRNFGHQAAYTAGLAHAKGEFIAMMDGDLQDPPSLIKEMYDKIIAEELDIVYGCRKSRNEGFVKRFLIKRFHKIFSSISNVHAPENVGNFSLMNRKALDAFLRLNEKNRYLPGLRYFIGFEQGFITYDRPDRTIGDAKMNFRKLFRLAMDALFSFSKLPIKLCLILGVLGIIFSLFGGGVVLVKKILGDAITGWTSTMLSIYFLGSVQLLFLGIIGEYIHRIFIESQNRPIYIVKDFYE
jgi:polyisoprenyl-phosphate glycosyltransferase